MSKAEKSPESAQVLTRTLMYMQPYWGLLVISAICSLVVGGMDGAFAYLIEPALRMIFDRQDITIFLLMPLGIILLFLIRGACRYVYDATIKLAGQKAIQDIRNDLYTQTIRQDISFYNRQTTGDLMSRMTNDITTMQEGVGQVVTGLFRDFISVLVLMGVIFYRNWQLATICFIVLPLTVYPAQLIGKRIKNAARRSLDVMGGLGTTMQENFSGIKVIKAFGLETHSTERFKQENHNYLQQIKRYIKYSSLATPVTEMITSLGIAAVIYFGGSQVLAGRMSPSELFSFIAAMIMLFTPIKKLQGSYNIIQRSAGAAERVFQTMDEQQQILDPENGISITRANGSIELEDVSFCYTDEPVLDGINLKVSPGQMVALVGPSGSGKTTLAALLMRFYDVKSGRILLDGHDLRTLKMASLNQQFALVDQETTLFNDTIANNIRYGKTDASDEEVINAAKTAFAHDFIIEFPDGYETNIGDRGARLSGGQRQRLCIARALLKNAPVLILDEATSALDTESEKMVQQALDNLVQNRTTIVIAHRLSTIVHADLIVVLENGKVVETGKHATLLEKNGIYSRLHSMQFGGEEKKV